MQITSVAHDIATRQRRKRLRLGHGDQGIKQRRGRQQKHSRFSGFLAHLGIGSLAGRKIYTRALPERKKKISARRCRNRGSSPKLRHALRWEYNAPGLIDAGEAGQAPFKQIEFKSEAAGNDFGHDDPL